MTTLPPPERILRALSAATLLGLALGLASAAQAETVLRRANGAEPKTLDPAKATGNWENHIISDLYEGLVTVDVKGQEIPGVAESWAVSPDGLTYVFKLRRDAKWSNGDPVTAEDFVYTWRRTVDPATASEYASNLYAIKNAEAINKGEIKDLAQLGVKALDPHTLEVTLGAPTPYFLGLLTHYSTFPVHKGSIDKAGKDAFKEGHLVGNGAFKLAEWKPQVQIKVVRNEHYREAGQVKLDAVVFEPTEELAAAIKRYRAGEFDLVYAASAPADQVQWFKANMPGHMRIAPQVGVYYYAFNVTRKPLDDVRVRRALSMAIDREAIADKILQGGQIPAYGIVSPGTNHYPEGAVADFKAMPQAERVAEAKKLLAEAGFGPDKPLKLTLSYNTLEAHKKIAVAVASMWKAVGMQTELSNSETKVHYDALKQHDFEVGRAGWVGDYNDPNTFLFLFQSNNKALNYSAYSNPEFDRLMDQANNTLDLGARAGLMKQAEAIALRDMPIAPIYYYVSTNVVQPYVKGWEPNALDHHLDRYVSLEK